MTEFSETSDLYLDTIVSQYIRYWPSLWTLAAIALSCSSNCQAQVDSRYKPGPVTERKQTIGKLIRLQIVEDRITLIEDWQSKSFLARHDELDEKVERLVKQGMDAASAANLVQKHLRSSKYSNPLSELFSKIVGDDRPISGRSSNSSQHVQAEYSTTSLLARINYHSPKFILSLKEKRAFKRTVLVQQQNDEFLFEYSASDFLVRLKQSPDKSVQLDLRNADGEQVFMGDNYEDLSKKHFAILQRELTPIFQCIGFEPPLVSSDDSVKNAVLARLVGIHGESNKEFQQLMRMLDSDDFDQREKASSQLLQERNKWRIQIQLELENPLPPEVRYRLRSIKKGEQSVNVIDSIIANQKLLSSPSYLVSLFDISNPKQAEAVTDQLEQLTGFQADDVQQWKAYVTGQSEGADN